MFYGLDDATCGDCAACMAFDRRETDKLYVNSSGVGYPTIELMLGRCGKCSVTRSVVSRDDAACASYIEPTKGRNAR